MRIDVALLPSLIRDRQAVFVVVDVLRASSSIVTLLERGAPAVIAAASVEEARGLRERLRCGGRGGRRVLRAAGRLVAGAGAPPQRRRPARTAAVRAPFTLTPP
jgi:hypothetical protein